MLAVLRERKGREREREGGRREREKGEEGFEGNVVDVCMIDE